MTANIQWIPQTEREFLATINDANGEPLAKAGARGRFSKAATEALAKARAEGFGFIGDKGHPQTEVKAPKVQKTVVTQAPKTETQTEAVSTATVPVQTPKTVQTSTVDAKAARAWAKSQGMTVGERGRLHPTVISAFLAANGSAPVSLVKTETQKAAAKPVRTRVQKVAYGVIPRKKGDPKYLSEPVLAVSACGKCKKGISYCTCETPSLPKHYGSAPCAFSLKDALTLHASRTDIAPSTA